MTEGPSCETLAERFREQAQAYCRFVDSLAEGRPAHMYHRLLELLSELAHGAVHLPYELLADWEEPEGLRPSHDEWRAVHKNIVAVLDPERTKLVEEHFNGCARKAAVRAHMVDDDLADIYGDLLHGLRLYALGSPEARRHARWTWRFGYGTHWGQHLFTALQTVHEIHYHLLGGWD